ncbi:IS3 family transposase [Streptomyces sp. NBC_00140]|uniref:IS3 family transposase n=1 Tax=Streptomyces sp. NBC_00140 TaxID=2975664 RepID=UPI00338F88D7
MAIGPGRPSARRRRDDELTEQISEVHADFRGAHDTSRVHAALREAGISCGRRRVARLMREACGDMTCTSTAEGQPAQRRPGPGRRRLVPGAASARSRSTEQKRCWCSRQPCSRPCRADSRGGSVSGRAVSWWRSRVAPER